MKQKIPTVISLLLATALLAGCGNAASGTSQAGANSSAPAPGSQSINFSAPLASLTAAPPALPKLAGTQYTAGQRKFTFEDLPQTDAETVICASLLLEITGEYDAQPPLRFGGDSEDWQIMTENGRQSYANDEGFASVTVQEVTELAEHSDLVSFKNPVTGELLLYHFYEKYGTNLTYDAYVGAFIEDGNCIVYIRYTCEYLPKTASAGPQLADGEREVVTLLVPGENSWPVIKQDTLFYADFYPED